MIPWEKLANAKAPDGETVELRRRGHEYLIVAGGYDLMSSEDDVSSQALAQLGLAHLRPNEPGRVLVGGLGMGFTLREALDRSGSAVRVQVAEFLPEVVEWTRQWLGDLAKRPLDDSRTDLFVGDVRKCIEQGKGKLDAILLDVDNGPDALAHKQNNSLYGAKGIGAAYRALRMGGVLGVWSFDDDPGYTRRLQKAGFVVETHRVSASRKGRGRFHQIWVAKKQRKQGR